MAMTPTAFGMSLLEVRAVNLALVVLLKGPEISVFKAFVLVLRKQLQRGNKAHAEATSLKFPPEQEVVPQAQEPCYREVLGIQIPTAPFLSCAYLSLNALSLEMDHLRTGVPAKAPNTSYPQR